MIGANLLVTFKIYDFPLSITSTLFFDPNLYSCRVHLHVCGPRLIWNVIEIAVGVRLVQIYGGRNHCSCMAHKPAQPAAPLAPVDVRLRFRG